MHQAADLNAESQAYIDSHLPRMLKREYGVVVNQYARKQLLLIRDDQKIQLYKPKLIQILDSDEKFAKLYAQEVLDQWAAEM